MKKVSQRKAGIFAESAPVEPSETAGEDAKPADRAKADAERPREIGGPKGPEPTRYGDWERNGRCSDF